MIKKIILLLILICAVHYSFAQKGPTFAYIDMEYILENVPQYTKAQNNLDEKVEIWKEKLKKLERHLEILKTSLANEQAILTKDLIAEREEDITIKQEELARFESLYFGPKGDMYFLRKQIIRPVQDQVYNAIQIIAKRKRYDFVFDKSNELVMLYSNKKYDISELVLSSIVKDYKMKESKENSIIKKTAREEKIAELKKASSSKKEAQQVKREAALKAREEKIAALKAASLSKKEAQKKAIQTRREAKLKEREEKRQLLRDKNKAREEEVNEQENN